MPRQRTDRAGGAYAIHAFTKVTPRADRVPKDSGDWICELEYPDVGREDSCPRCNHPTRLLNTVTVLPEGSAVRYFTVCAPLCRPDDHISKEITEIIARALVENFRKNGWPTVDDAAAADKP